jgi:hypothetical protein
VGVLQKHSNDLQRALDAAEGPCPLRLRSGDYIAELLGNIQVLEERELELESRPAFTVQLKDARNHAEPWFRDLLSNQVVRNGVSLTKVLDSIMLPLTSVRTVTGERLEISKRLATSEAGRKMASRSLLERGVLGSFHVARLLARARLGSLNFNEDLPDGYEFKWFVLFFDGTTLWNGREFQDLCVGYEEPVT